MASVKGKEIMWLPDLTVYLKIFMVFIHLIQWLQISFEKSLSKKPLCGFNFLQLVFVFLLSWGTRKLRVWTVFLCLTCMHYNNYGASLLKLVTRKIPPDAHCASRFLDEGVKDTLWWTPYVIVVELLCTWINYLSNLDPRTIQSLHGMLTWLKKTNNFG